MKLLSLFKRKVPALPVPFRHPLVGTVVMDVQLDGCMATDAKILRVGTVTNVLSHERIWGHRLYGGGPGPHDYAVCRTIRPEFSDIAEQLGEEIFRVPLFGSWVEHRDDGVLIWRH